MKIILDIRIEKAMDFIALLENYPHITVTALSPSDNDDFHVLKKGLETLAKLRADKFKRRRSEASNK